MELGKYISIYKTTEIAKLLLASGADMNARNKDGNTALMIADECNSLMVAELLKDAGAEPPPRKRRTR